LTPRQPDFLPGHPVPKSPNSAYRIAPAFLEILKASGLQRAALLKAWGSEDATRARLQVHATLAEATRAKVGTPAHGTHHGGRQVMCRISCPVSTSYTCDATDGQRVTFEQQQALAKAGITIRLDDPMPDILLWNPTTDKLWVVEAVTSDGEVDLHKVEGLTRMAERSGKKSHWLHYRLHEMEGRRVPAGASTRTLPQAPTFGSAKTAPSSSACRRLNQRPTAESIAFWSRLPAAALSASSFNCPLDGYRSPRKSVALPECAH